MATAPDGGWRVTVHYDWNEAAPLWRPFLAGRRASPFQSERWLARWYQAFSGRPGIRPLLVHAADAAGVPAMALPLVVRRGRLRTIEFADLGITDYNAPLLGPSAPVDRAGALALVAAIRAALPAADLLDFSKLLASIDGRPNPLLLAFGGQESSLFGNLVRIDGSYEDWFRGLKKHNRQELGRFWRVFTRHEGAAFSIAGTADEALRLHERLERQQSERLREMGKPYLLDDPLYAGFYRDLVRDGLSDGTMFISGLNAGDELVAGLLGIADGDHFAMVRISTGATGDWANCSPGRLVIERTMEALHGRGFRTFDFTIGDYAYKRGFEVDNVPLFEIREPLSWRAWPSLGYESAKAYVKQNETLSKLARKVMRRAA